MFRLASLTKPAICYSPTKYFNNGKTDIVRAVIMFPIPGTYVSNIYGLSIPFPDIWHSGSAQQVTVLDLLCR